jgi:hypothetical protein
MRNRLNFSHCYLTDVSEIGEHPACLVFRDRTSISAAEVICGIPREGVRKLVASHARPMADNVSRDGRYARLHRPPPNSGASGRIIAMRGSIRAEPTRDGWCERREERRSVISRISRLDSAGGSRIPEN